MPHGALAMADGRDKERGFNLNRRTCRRLGMADMQSGRGEASRPWVGPGGRAGPGRAGPGVEGLGSGRSGG